MRACVMVLASWMIFFLLVRLKDAQKRVLKSVQTQICKKKILKYETSEKLAAEISSLVKKMHVSFFLTKCIRAAGSIFFPDTAKR